MARFLIATPLHSGSLSAYFVALARELKARNHQTCILASPDPARPSIPPEDLSVQSWPSRRPTGVSDARFLLRLLRKWPVDCVVSNFGAVNLSVLIGSLLRIPCRIAWYHTLTSQLRIDMPPPGIFGHLQAYHKRWIYRLTTTMVANSSASAEDLINEYQVAPEKCSVLHFLLNDPPPAAVVRNPLKLVCVARFHPSKGQTVLLRALPRVFSFFPNVEVEFVGDGPTLDSCKNLAANLGIRRNCLFRGVLPIDEVFNSLASAALCVSPSIQEALGLVNIESQAMGTPVVASFVGGIKEVIEDSSTGYLVPPGDYHSLAYRLVQLLSNSDLREQLGVAARRHFLSRFSMCNIHKHAAFFESLLPGISDRLGGRPSSTRALPSPIKPGA